MKTSLSIIRTIRLGKISFFAAFLLLIAGCNQVASHDSINFNNDWLFFKGESPDAKAAEFNDSTWQALTLPHDWAIEGPFDPKYNARTGGLPVHGTGWYRKHFTVDKSHKGKLISILFDGAMSNAKVWVNGHLAGERPYGYIGFEVDITPFVKYGESNVIAVRLSPEDLASRWYPGAGIYRNTRMIINNPLHIPVWGTYITTPEVSADQATVNIETSIKNNNGTESSAILQTEIYSPDGSCVGSQRSEIIIQAGKESKINHSLKVRHPNLWDLNSPTLYKAVSTVRNSKNIIDRHETAFGIRHINFSSKSGFELNHKPVKFKGVCLHHDLGPLGTAINYSALERKVKILKEMGVNAIRTSHNPPSPELLTVCDKLGVLVQTEAFDEWRKGKVPNGYNKHFDQWHERDLRDMIRRDRNHPSVIMYSIGNEILEQGDPEGWKIAKELTDICHDEDPTRPTTAGFNYYPAPFVNKLAEYVDIVGMNYWPLHYQEILKKNPDMIVYGSETSSQTSSRGIYHLPIQPEEKHSTGQVSSFDAIVGPPWAYPPDVEFEQQEKVQQSLGEFMWTGFDYLGEPTPYGGRDNSTNGYWNDDWPSHSSYFGPIDLCGFPKDRFYLYQSQWTNDPMVHHLPHWNWKGREGDSIPVFAYTNCDEVELFVNGKSFGRKQKGVDLTAIPAEFHGFEKGKYNSKYRLSWQVPYQPGSIKTVAYRDGKKVAEKEIKTAGKPYKVVLYPEKETITANGVDLAFIKVRIEDKNGNLCPRADNRVTFDVTGQGKISSVGNGDPTCTDSFKANNMKAFSGLCLLIVKPSENPGEILIEAKSPGLEPERLTIKTTDF